MKLFIFYKNEWRIASCYCDVVCILGALNNLMKEAKNWLNKALNVQVKYMVKYILILWNYIPHTSYKLADYHELKNSYTKPLNISLQIHGERHTITAGIYLNLARACYFSDDLENPKNHCSKALQVFEELNGKDHSNTIEAIQILNEIVKETNLNEAIRSNIGLWL